MALERKYLVAFRIECEKLSYQIVESVRNLRKNPANSKEIERIVQCADTIIGGAKFLEYKELEERATRIVRSFKGVKDVSERFDDLCLMSYDLEFLLNNHMPKKSQLLDSDL